MPEIKTCEQYVLNELFTTQQEKEKLEEALKDMRFAFNNACNENTMLHMQLKELQSELNTLKGIKEIEK